MQCKTGRAAHPSTSKPPELYGTTRKLIVAWGRGDAPVVDGTDSQCPGSGCIRSGAQQPERARGSATVLGGAGKGGRPRRRTDSTTPDVTAMLTRELSMTCPVIWARGGVSSTMGDLWHQTGCPASTGAGRHVQRRVVLLRQTALQLYLEPSGGGGVRKHCCRAISPLSATRRLRTGPCGRGGDGGSREPGVR